MPTGQANNGPGRLVLAAKKLTVAATVQAAEVRDAPTDRPRGGRCQQAMERLAGEDNLRHPLAVPPK
jgi:hypothetical protein